MGKIYSHLRGRVEPLEPGAVGRKRKHEEVDEESVSQTGSGGPDVLNTPKRKRIKSTSKYIYQTLFLEGENSDITIRALDMDWKLHKLYLKQSAYFNSMFCGSWRESSMETINIDIVDENITEESLKIAFGSLYKDDVFIKPVQIVGVLAAATLLQLEGLIQQCTVMMMDTLSSATVCVYLSASQSYGAEDMKTCCLAWLTTNLLAAADVTFIRDISVPLMVEIVSCPQLFVLQVEIDIYSILKKWVFLQCNSEWTGTPKELIAETDAYVKRVLQDSSECFLQSEQGRQFLPAFSAVRWHHVINDMCSIKIIENDKILPIAWLEPMFLYGWRHVLHIEQGLDKGPAEVDEIVFNQSCVRCGRVLAKQGDYCWRWVGYSYGLDILVSLTNRLISIKRNTHTESCPQAVSLQAQRQICYRMTVASLDKEGRTKMTKSTGIKTISLGKDEEEIAMLVEKRTEFPLVISMNLMVVSPLQDLPIPQLAAPHR